MVVESKRITFFHAFASCEEADYLSKLHVHGLNRSYLRILGFDNELALLLASKDWLKKKHFTRE